MTTAEMQERGLVIQSGDEIGTETACYNCGTPFADNVTSQSHAGECIVCGECGGRCGYIKEV